MKFIERYFAATAATVVLASSCAEVLNPDDIEKANPGDEVVFGAALPGKTKTVYGEENTENKTFPIYWVNGDKVRVASPQCLSGRNSAEYQIAVDGKTQNFATSMTKTGETGVQWGEAATADFYSIYPSSASTALEVSGEGVSTNLHVDITQFASTTDNGTSYYAQPAEMGNVVMYAKTAGVKSGSTVELHYVPFSTVLEFEINAPTEQIASKQTTITIQSLTITAPTGTTIAGNFAFTFPTGDATTPSIKAEDGGSNTITMHFLANNQYSTVLSLDKPQLKAKMCLMPISGVENLADWKVEVNTSAGTFAKTLASTTGALKPGLVHKIKLPKLKYASDEWNYDPGNWIPSLPDYRNIYLSEISLPGAWYAGSTEAYQATNDIATLWNAGVRAFAIETRSNVTTSGWLNTAADEPSSIVVSGSGKNSLTDKTTGTNTLNGTQTDGKAYHSGTDIANVITSIANSVKEDEFGVLVISYADGGEGGHRNVDHGAWLQLLYDTFNGLDATVKEKIYQYQVTANTTVNSVLGKLILKINVDENIAMGGSVNSTSYSYENTLPALFSYNPFLFQMEGADYARPYYSTLSWMNWGDGSNYRSYDLVVNLQGASGNAGRFVWVFSSANRTQLDTGTDTTIPQYKQRQAALGAMMSFSNQIYQASTHNVWFYFNCGGTEAKSISSSSPSPTAFADKMNGWLLNTIKAKSNPSPLGIVMFNQCTNEAYNGPAIIDAIIKMNSKFYLKHAGTTGGSTGGTQENTPSNDSILEDGGSAI